MPDNMVVVSGQSAEFEELFREHYEAVCRYAARRVEPAAVGDLAAEVFLVAWRRRDRIEGEPLPWLLGVARRVCANHLRSRGRRRALDGRLAFERPPDADERLAFERPPDVGERLAPRIDDAGLRAALESLRPGDRELLTLVAWEGLDSREISQMLGCSPRTLAVRLHRARRRLALALAVERTGSATAAKRTDGTASKTTTEGTASKRTEGMVGNETC